MSKNGGQYAGDAADAVDADTAVTIENVRDYIAGHYQEPLSIEQLAHLTGLSPNYFGEAFKRKYGQSAMNYLTELRIGHAKQLLRESDLYLRDIARSVGYSDEFYFSRKFKREVGMSPSAYSSTVRKRIAVLSSAAIGNLLPLGLFPTAAPLDPKWSPYYYNSYYASIKVHLDARDTGDEEDTYRKLAGAKTDVLFLYDQEEVTESLLHRLCASGTQLVRVDAADWRGQLRETASVLEMGGRAESWIRDHEARALQARAHIRRAAGEEQFLVLRLSGDEIFLYCNRGIRDVLYRDLSLRSCLDQEALYNEAVTLDRLQALDPDRLLLLICPDADTRIHWLALQHHESWLALRAVRSGALYQVLSSPWFEYSATAVRRMLDETQAMLTGKCPNDSPDSVHGVHASAPL